MSEERKILEKVLSELEKMRKELLLLRVDLKQMSGPNFEKFYQDILRSIKHYLNTTKEK